MSARRKPNRPVGLAARGRKFWDDTLADFELARDELELLAEVCRTLDQLDQLREALAVDGMTVRGSEGQPRVHPAVTQINATRTSLGRLLAQLALPDPDGEVIPSQASVRASKASQARWADHYAKKAHLAEVRRNGAGA